MAHFRAVIQGQRGEASRLGSSRTGIRATVNGWNSGVRVEGSALADNAGDFFHIFATAGSNGATGDRFLGKVFLDKQTGAIAFIPASEAPESTEREREGMLRDTVERVHA